MSFELCSAENPRKWRFTWEAQSHIPILRLLVFDSHTNPSSKCQNLKVNLLLARSLVTLSWFQERDVTINVPLPRVLVDAESPVSFRAFDDHIEVKLVLLLPVDHPIVMNFDSVLDLSEDRENECSDPAKFLSVDSDQKTLSSSGGVEFYCRSCSFKLTKRPIRNFVEMPSVNWREVADNWFGSCCCSFGGISEKLVTSYTNSYTCAKGVCLLTATTITLSKDDLIGSMFLDHDGIQGLKNDPDFTCDNGITEAKQSLGSNRVFTEKPKFEQFKDAELARNSEGEVTKEESDDGLRHVASPPGCCDRRETQVLYHDDQGCTHHMCRTFPEDQKPVKIIEIQNNLKPFLNGFLGNVFMVRSSNLSADIDWMKYLCPHCSSVIGAYPCRNSSAPVDGGVRLFKCYVSTYLPVDASGNLFRKYTLERMFANQLLESAKDESSFRTVVKDLKKKSPMLQIVLINTNSWSSSGYSLGTKGTTESVPKIELLPVIKVLYSDCSKSAESQLRTMEDWLRKDEAEEVFMLKHQIEELLEVLVSRKDLLPPSYSTLEGLSLSSLGR